MNDANQKMGGGHCDGLATLSSLLYDKTNEQGADYGADTTAKIAIDGNEKLQRRIAYWWATHLISPTIDEKPQNFANLPKPTDAEKKVIAATIAKPETYTL